MSILLKPYTTSNDISDVSTARDYMKSQSKGDYHGLENEAPSNIKGWSTSNGEAHGTYHMANHPNLYEIQRSNNFEFVVGFTRNLLRAGLTRDVAGNQDKKASPDNFYIKDDVAQEVVRMSVSSAFVPHFTQNPIEVRRGNSSIKYAGVPNFQDGSLQLVDYIGADTLSVLMAWQNLSYNVRTEKVGLASDYKLNANLVEYTPDNIQVRVWELKGCWVSGISEPEFNSESNDKRLITVNIVYDKAWLRWAVDSGEKTTTGMFTYIVPNYVGEKPPTAPIL